MRAFRLRGALLALMVIVGLSFLVFRCATHKHGYFVASEYPRLFKKGGWARYGLPATLPPNATDVLIYAPASEPSLIPSPDQFVEVRFFLPKLEADALITASSMTAKDLEAAHAANPLPIDDSILPDSHTADDADPSTPLPSTFQSFILTNPSGMNVGGVLINPATGEVVYWISEL